MVRNIFHRGQDILTKQQSSILSAAALITASSLLSALLGLLRNRLLVSKFFSTALLQSQLDAYWVAFRLPELAFQLLVIGSISAAFIPVYSKYRQRGLATTNTMVSTMMTLVLLVFVVISVVIFMFAEQLNSFITSANFTQEQVILAANLSRVMLLAQLFFGVSNFVSGILQAHQRFLIPALSPIAYNAGIIFGILVLSPVIGIYGPAVGVVMGALLHLLLQVPFVRGLKFSYRPVVNLGHPGVREMLRLMPPRTLAISVGQLELFASVYFATALAPGSLTIINLAQQLMGAPNRIFSVPLGQASLPFLSKQVADKNLKEFKRIFMSTMRHVLFLAMPASVLLLILRVPLVRIVYGSSEFPWTATLLTGKAVAILSISLFAQGGIQLLTRAFYALHNTKVPLVASLISVMINISISYLAVFVYGWGVLGLATALTVSTLVHFLVLTVMIGIRIKGHWVQGLVTPALKILVASGVMAVFLWVPMRLLDQFVFDTTKVVPLMALTLIAGVVGGGVYLLLAKALRILEYTAYVSLIKRLGKIHKLLMPSEEILETPTQAQEVKPM